MDGFETSALAPTVVIRAAVAKGSSSRSTIVVAASPAGVLVGVVLAPTHHPHILLAFVSSLTGAIVWRYWGQIPANVILLLVLLLLLLTLPPLLL